MKEKNNNLLKFTDNISKVFFYENDYSVSIYNYYKQNIIKKILCDDFQLLTFSEIANIIDNQTNDLKLINDDEHLSNIKINLNNNVFNINEHSILPASLGYKFSQLSYSYFYYLRNLYTLPKDKNVLIIKYIPNYFINLNNNSQKIDLYYDIERLLNFNTNCKTKTIFIINLSNKQSYEIISEDFNHEIINLQNFDFFNFIKKQNENFDAIFIDKLYFIPQKYCQSELSSLPLYLLSLCIGLNLLKSNGDLFFNIDYVKFLPSLQLLYLLSINFKNYNLVLNDLIIKDLGFYKFSDFYNNTDFLNLLSKILEQIISSNFDDIYKLNDLPFNCFNYVSKENNFKNIIIKKIKIKSSYPSHQFLDFVNKNYYLKNQIIKKELQKIKYFDDNFKNTHEYITNYLLYQIEKASSFCKNYSIAFNPLCNININNLELAKTFFPDVKDLNILKKLKFNSDSVYSVSYTELAKRISEYIKKDFPTVKNIIDGTANIGGNTVNFSKNFNNVVSIEIMTNTFEILKNNIDVLEIKNVIMHNQDIIQFIIKNKFNTYDTCLFLDPPWTGPFYKLSSVIDLYFGDINVIDFLKDIASKKIIKYICMKVPKNFNFTYLFDNFKYCNIYRSIGCYVIMIFI